MKMLKIITVGIAGLTLVGSAFAEGGAKHAHAPEGGWSFEGGANTVLGSFDKASVQRGYQVYREVCAACHSMNLLSYRNLGEPRGPYYDSLFPNANENPIVKAFAAEDEILDGPDDEGDMFFRPGRSSDPFRNPYANDAIARAANGGALPPDLSVITKARHGGASYVYSLLAGYPENSETKTLEDGTFVTVYEFGDDHGGHDEHAGDHGVKGTLVQPVGQYYNPYFPGDTTPQFDGDPRHVPPGGFLAMAPQLVEGRVEYADGTPATVDQMAKDVATFLAWAAEPKQENRKSLGLAVMMYLVIFAILLWFSYKRIWRDVAH